jgi:hypothetical protein
MSDQKQEITEDIQQMTARLLATTPPGVRLALIGGFRYRFLDQGSRVSRDIDYHWDGDLQAKQSELISAFKEKLLPQVRRKFGYSGRVVPHCTPEGDSLIVRTILMTFWRDGEPGSQIELPVDITRIAHTDKFTVKTRNGVVYPTPSDLDMIESKIIAVFARTVLRHRDLVDIFMFANHLAATSPQRINGKLTEKGIDRERLKKRMDGMADGRAYHSGSIDELIRTQLDPAAAANLDQAGGGGMVLVSVLKILRQQVADFIGGGQ